MAGARFSNDLAEDAGAEIGVRGREIEAANFLVCRGGGAAFPGAGGMRYEMTAGENASRRAEVTRSVGIASEFVEANGDGLAEVDGAMVFTGRDAQEP